MHEVANRTREVLRQDRDDATHMHAVDQWQVASGKALNDDSERQFDS